MISISQKRKEIYQVPESKHGLEACHPRPPLEDLFVLVSSGQFLLTSCQVSYFGSLSSRDGEMSYGTALAKWQA